MPYPLPRPGKHLFSCFAILLLAVGATATPAAPDLYCLSSPVFRHISPKITLYARDSSLEPKRSGIVRHQKNGDIVIAIPAGASGHYKIRFFSEDNALMFEVREIRDPLLIVEKYNFGHAGLFLYELYRDNSLIERNSFRIIRE
jgi:hypothetical protein